MSDCVCELVWNVPVAGKAYLCMTFELREIPLASFAGPVLGMPLCPPARGDAFSWAAGAML